MIEAMKRTKEPVFSLICFAVMAGAMSAVMFIAYDIFIRPVDKTKYDFMHQCVVVDNNSEWRCDEKWKWR